MTLVKLAGEAQDALHDVGYQLSLTELARPLLGAVTSEGAVMRLTRGALVTEARVTRITCHVSGLIDITLDISVTVSRSVITGV